MGGTDRETDPIEKLYRIRLFTYRGLQILLVVAIILSVSWVSVRAYSVGWVVVEVDGSTVTCCPAVAKAPTGALLVAYGATDGLILATQEGGSWSFSSVIAVGTFSVRDVALAVDNAGGVHIASISYWPEVEPIGANRLIYSERTPSGWENAIIDEDVSPVSVSIAVDSDSNAHISYAVSSDWWSYRNLTYATDSAGEWATYDISSQFPHKFHDLKASSICVDSTGKPSIALLADYMAGCITNLSGTPIFEIVAWGNAGTCVEPSRPSIWVDTEDAIHVLCVNTVQDAYDAPITQKLVHYIVADGPWRWSYESHFTSSTDFSRAATDAVKADDQCLRVFYSGAGGIGVITLTGGIHPVDETLHVRDRATQGSWFPGISVTYREGGECVVSKPYGSVGYLTDTFTFSDRLSTAISPIQSALLALAIVIIVIAIAVILSRREFIEEAKWRESLKKNRL